MSILFLMQKIETNGTLLLRQFKFVSAKLKQEKEEVEGRETIMLDSGLNPEPQVP